MYLPLLPALLLAMMLGGPDVYSQTNAPKTSLGQLSSDAAADGAAFAPTPDTATVSSPQINPGGRRVLAQIRIFGLHRIEEETVKSKLKAREWAPYSPEDKALDTAALLASGDFTAVKVTEVNLSGSAFRLDIEVTEASPRASASTAAPEAPWQPIAYSTAALQQLVRSSTTATPAPHPSSAPRFAWTAPAPSSAAKTSSGGLAPPWVLSDIAVNGNRNVKYNVIRSQIKARKGDLYDRSDLDHDIKALYDMGDFERVAGDISGVPDKPIPSHLLDTAGSTIAVRLTFVVEEKPLVRKIRFEGNKYLSRGKLSDTVALKEKDPLDRAKLNEDARKIRELYEEKGFLTAGVDPKIDIDTASAMADITLRVNEGPRTLIDQVVLEGLHAFKPKKVLKQMDNRRKKVLQEPKLPDDLKKIEALYKNNGYLDFQISSHTVAFSPDRTKATITVWLSEGHTYRFGTTAFSGNTVYTTALLAQKTIEYHRGKIFNQGKFEETIHNIQDLYADKGYLRARVAPQKIFNESTNQMDVNFQIAEGQIVYIDHIDVDGNHATKTYVLKREVVLKPGEPFSSSKLRKSIDRMRNLGFLDDVEPDIQPAADPDKVDLTLDVTEGKPGMLTAGAGFSSLDGLLGTLSLQHLNLFGRAQRASVQWSFGARVQDYSLSWTTPWIKNKPMSLGFDLFNTRRLSPFQSSLSAYTSKRTGGTIRLGPRFQDDMYRLDFRYTFMQIGITNVQNQFLGTLTEGTSISSSLGADFARDTRDNYLDPTHGALNSIGMDLSGGPLLGQINYWSPHIQDAIHFTLANPGDWPLVLSFSNRSAYVTPFGDTKEVPIFSRYFLGGQDTLRGYAPTGEVGTPSGGKVYDVFNVELGYPLARERKKSIVKLVTFFDAGSAWDNVRSVSARFGTQDNNVKTDIGFGIRFVTPAFPIRLDYGYGLNHRPGEKAYQINFGIGSLF